MTLRIVCCALVWLGLLGRVCVAQHTLSCEPLAGQLQEKEAPYLASAPHGATRPSRHRLVVRWSKGIREFVDQAPYMEGDMDGSRYLYCGYSHELGFHLIYKIDEASSRGVLLDDATGRILPAGEVVIFSGNAQRYFASVQPEGLDGKEWYVYSKKGVQLWKGLSGISAKHPRLGYDYFVATLEAPGWSAANELQATLKCAADEKREVIVTLRAVKGRFAWTPIVPCPTAK